MRAYPAVIISRSDGDLAEQVTLIVDDFQPVAADETPDGLRVFFADPGARDHALAALRDQLPHARISRLDVPDENWAARSQAMLTAVRVGALTIAPPWDANDSPERTIVILPSMGFGTGHHATTRLCLLAMQSEDRAGKSVLDVGTGSGVLALAASRLGAAPVVGVDNDPDAIANALENRSLNGLDVEFRCEGIDVAAGGPFDIVLANLTGAMLTRFAPRLLSLRAATGQVIVSGLREEEEDGVVRAFGQTPIARAAEDGWLCLVI